MIIAAFVLCASQMSPQRFVLGTEASINGAVVRTWARVSARGAVESVGATVPISLFANPPANGGPGPARSLVVLLFPTIARSQTLFNHFEMQWQPHGHRPYCCFGKPHFDFHFYSIPPDRVWKIVRPDKKPPSADLVPKGYIYPGAMSFIRQMGVHMVQPKDLNPKEPFTARMVIGFEKGRIDFIEPMVLRTFLLAEQSVSLPVAAPQRLLRATRYPTEFHASFDSKSRSYSLVFDHFVKFTR